MKKNDFIKDGSYRHSEEELSREKETTQSLTNVDSLRLIHELQALQVDLETQKRELTQARVEAEKAIHQYADLYDLAPVGYFMLARDGTILRVNLLGADLVGVERGQLVNQQLGAFVLDDYLPVFNAFLQKMLSGRGTEACELMFRKNGKDLFWAHIEASCFEGGQECRAVITDISGRKRIEQALQESENRFRAMLHNVPTIAVQGYGMDGTTQYWNSASEKLYGYSTQDAIGQNLLDLIIPPEMRTDVKQAIQHMAKTGQPIPAAELSLMRKDGSRVTVYSSHAVVSIPGRAPELFCLDVDLSERKQLSSLLQARVRISEFVDFHTFDDLLQKTLDEAEALTGSSIGFAHFLEPDQKTLKLQMWSTNTIKNMCTAEGKGQHYAVEQAGVWVDCVHTRTPVIHNDYISLPHRKGLPDGHAPVVRELVVPVLRNDLVVMIMGVGNKPTDYDDNDVEAMTQLANSVWDIVQRKQAEDALKASERKYRLLYESMLDGFVSVDMTGKFLDFNEVYKDMLGYSETELSQLTYFDITPENWHEFEADIVKNQILERGYSDVYEKEYRRKDGTIFPVELHTVLLRDEQGLPRGMWAIVRDITSRKKMDTALRESQEMFSLFMQHSPIYTFIKSVTSSESRVLQASDNFHELTGIPGLDMVGHTMDELFPAEFAAKISSDDWDVVSNGMILKLDEELNGRHYTTIKFPIIWGDKTLLAGYTIDISERKRAEQELAAANSELQTAFAREQQLARTDALTGVNNRRHLYELAEHEFDVAVRYGQPLSVIMFDIDHFKKVNDIFGHTVGDQILERVAQVASSELRSADVLGRYGGEEFIILLPMTNAQQAYSLAERIRVKAADMNMPTSKGEASVTLSIGVIEIDRASHLESVEEVFRRADQAMYSAKQAGRNRTVISIG